MHVVTLDWETYYDSKDYTLSKMGPIEYIRDPRFTELCLGVRVDRGETMVFDAEDIHDVLVKMELHRPDRIVLGHNMNGFDALILSEIHGIRPAFIADTMTVARWCGLSRMMAENHKTLTAYLGNGEKKPGTVVSNGKRYREDFTPEDWEFFKQYCADDVTQCSENFFRMARFMTVDAMKFSSITAKMATEPCLTLRTDMLESYIKELDDRAADSMTKVSKMFNFRSKDDFLTAIRSAPKFVDMLRMLGTEPPMKYSDAKSQTKKKQMEAAGQDTSDPESWAVYAPALAKSDLDFAAMAEDPDPRVALLVQTRLEHNSSIERSRAVRFHQLSLSGRPMPAMLKCFHAWTSRYGAGNSEGATDGLNLQNLGKRNPAQLTLRKSIRAPKGFTFVACDSSQIEARMLAFIAGEQELVQQFREGRDPYSELAEKIFGVPWQEIKAGAKSGNKRMKNYRNVGKTAILSAGYGVGWKKFSTTLLRQGVHLSPDIDEHHEQAKQAHQIYRMSNPNIVAFWDYCQKVIESLAAGGEGYFGGPSGDAFHYGMMEVPVAAGAAPMLIPSIQMKGCEYILRYPNLHWEKSDKKRGEYLYERSRGKNMVPNRIYGGALTENLIQGLAFQLLMWQACRMDERGLHLVCNIHDAFLVCVPSERTYHAKGIMEEVMASVPPWLEGFPVACEAEIGTDYTIA